MIRHTRWLMVSPMWVAAFVACNLLFEFLLAQIARRAGIAADVPELLRFRWMFGNFVGIALFAYGVCRIWQHHPLHDSAYRSWLEVSPWTSLRPLPKGPVHPVWQDALLIGIVMIIGATRWELHPLTALSAFAAGYSLMACPAMFHTRRPQVLIGTVLMLIPVMILLKGHHLPMSIVAVALLIVTHLGLSQSLEAFPWPRKKSLPDLQLLGPVVGRLGPVPLKQLIPTGIGLKVAVILGWWIYVVGHTLFERERPSSYDDLSGLVIMVIVLVAIIRGAAYCNNYHWPLSLFGRITTGRWIIPKYDYVLITPILTVLGGVAAYFLCHFVSLPLDAGVAIATTVTFAVVFEGGPTMQNWQLTGGHSMLPFKNAPQKRTTSTSPLEREISSFFG